VITGTLAVAQSSTTSVISTLIVAHPSTASVPIISLITIHDAA